MTRFPTPEPSEPRPRAQYPAWVRAAGWLPAVGMMSLILAASSQPALGDQTFLWDQLVAWFGEPAWLLRSAHWVAWADALRSPIGHTVEYGLLALTFALGWRSYTFAAGRTRWLAFLCTALFAVLDEWVQSHVPNRTPSFADLLWDWSGAAAALWLIAPRLLLDRRPSTRPEVPDHGEA